MVYPCRCFSIAGNNPEDAFCELWDSINLPPKPVLKNKKVVAYESYPWSAGDFDKVKQTCANVRGEVRTLHSQ